MIPVGYTRIVSGRLHRVTTVVLLSVLSGAPAVAVVCAELCPPAVHQQQTEHEGPSCHGHAGTGPAMTSQQVPDCGDHGAPSLSALASLLASRVSHLAVMHPGAASPAHGVSFPSVDHALTSSEGKAPPPRPEASSRVLRI